MPIVYSTRSYAKSLAEFEAKAGMSPQEWEKRWAAEEIEDSAENMALTIATGLQLELESEISRAEKPTDISPSDP